MFSISNSQSEKTNSEAVFSILIKPYLLSSQKQSDSPTSSRYIDSLFKNLLLRIKHNPTDITPSLLNGLLIASTTLENDPLSIKTFLISHLKQVVMCLQTVIDFWQQDKQLAEQYQAYILLYSSQIPIFLEKLLQLGVAINEENSLLTIASFYEEQATTAIESRLRPHYQFRAYYYRELAEGKPEEIIIGAQHQKANENLYYRGKKEKAKLQNNKPTEASWLTSSMQLLHNKLGIFSAEKPSADEPLVFLSPPSSNQ